MDDMQPAAPGADAEAQRIRELIIEAGALVEWVDSGRGDLDVVGAALLYLRDELSALADTTDDEESCQTACAMVAAIERALGRAAAGRKGNAA